jgi:hypothetical protein
MNNIFVPTKPYCFIYFVRPKIKNGKKMKWQEWRSRLYMDHINVKNFIAPLLIFACMVAVLMCVYTLWGSENIWFALTAAGGNALHFCELNRVNELVRQPANTWSNLGFLAVGLAITAIGVADFKQGNQRKMSANFMVRYPIFSVLFGLSAMYVGLGSLLYHASLTEFFQKHDQMGMYALVFTILALSIHRIFPVIKFFGRWRSFHGLNLCGAAATFLLVSWMWKYLDINLFFPLCLALVLLSHLYYEFFLKKSEAFTKYIISGFLCLVMGFTIWMLDRTHIWCDPESWLQGHAIWHVLTALSALFVYLYYRTDSAPIPDKLQITH